MVSPSSLKAVIEALLFAHEAPLGPKELQQVLTQEGLSLWTMDEITAALEAIRGQYNDNPVQGFYLEEVAGGYQFRSKPEFAPFLRQLQKEKPYRLSRSALEVLSIIAYRQPVSRIDIEDIRGVDSHSPLKTLLERGLIRSLGHSDDVGHPVLYGTTALFLEVFTLKDLENLPPLEATAATAETGRQDAAHQDAARQDAEAEDAAHSPEPQGFEQRFSEHLIRMAEESEVDSSLIDELQEKAIALATVENRVVESAFPAAPTLADGLHETTSSETHRSDEPVPPQRGTVD